MKTINYLFVVLFAIVLFACNDDDELKDPDFSVLGITSIRINDSVYSVGENLQMENTGSTISITGSKFVQSQMHGGFTYAIITQQQETQSVEITSRYSDVSIVKTTEKPQENATVIKCEITRSGYDEHFTYEFGFVNFN